jgi:maltodextrin utilization protein YvdJ
MPELRNKPVLVGKVNLWWYAIALPLILALLYLGFSGIASPLFALLGLFAFFFWLTSLILAIWTKLR